MEIYNSNMGTFSDLVVPITEISLHKKDIKHATEWVNHSFLFWIIKSENKKWFWELDEEGFSEDFNIPVEHIVQSLQESFTKDKVSYPIFFNTLKEAKQDVLARVKNFLTEKQWLIISHSFFYSNRSFNVKTDNSLTTLIIQGTVNDWHTFVEKSVTSIPLKLLLPQNLQKKITDQVSKYKALQSVCHILENHLDQIYSFHQDANVENEPFYDLLDWYQPFIKPSVHLPDIF